MPGNVGASGSIQMVPEPSPLNLAFTLASLRRNLGDVLHVAMAPHSLDAPALPRTPRLPEEGATKPIGGMLRQRSVGTAI